MFVLDSVLWCGSANFLAAYREFLHSPPTVFDVFVVDSVVAQHLYREFLHSLPTVFDVFVLDSVLWCGSATSLAARPVIVFVVIVLDFVSWCGAKFFIPPKNRSLCYNL